MIIINISLLITESSIISSYEINPNFKNAKGGCGVHSAD